MKVLLNTVPAGTEVEIGSVYYVVKSQVGKTTIVEQVLPKSCNGWITLLNPACTISNMQDSGDTTHPSVVELTQAVRRDFSNVGDS